MKELKELKASPFIKWAGGKTQLLNQISPFLPKEKIYYEPFLGGAAMFFYIHEKIEQAYLSDLNKDLVNLYSCVKNNVQDLILLLQEHKSKYTENKEKYYSSIRDEYNSIDTSIKKASMFLFLNKTCFNGLYRVNSSGKFNVPIGDYKNPCICNAEELKLASKALQKATIINSSYDNIIPVQDSWMYLDPPYRALNKTSSFNSYTNNSFNDSEQIKLAEYFKKQPIKMMLSNSDPKNINPNDNFFDDLYSDFVIKRLQAKRIINSKAQSRGSIKEILVMNYESVILKEGTEELI